jgi:adenylosuccinate lyase
MVVISPTELSSNLNKYLQLAQNEKIIIQRGQDEAYELVKKERLITVDDVQTALTGAQLKARMHTHIDNLFNV